MKRKRRQEVPRLTHRTIIWGAPFDQAVGVVRTPQWLKAGLERFANTKDSLDDYRVLSKVWPTFWPLPIDDGHMRDLAWDDKMHPLFLFYRDTLRRFWTRDLATISDGFKVQLLFGTVDRQGLFADVTPSDPQWSKAVTQLKYAFPEARVSNIPQPAVFWPDWNRGAVEYYSQSDFQRAFWQLFSESWRAKVCPTCSNYFFAEKPPQLYCGVACSNSAHKSRSLQWWRKEGVHRRHTKSKSITKSAGTPLSRKGEK